MVARLDPRLRGECGGKVYVGPAPVEIMGPRHKAEDDGIFE
jgi:hypothetical protein